MKSKALGTSISPVEVTNVSQHGLWLLIHDREFFLSYQDHPWFKDARVTDLFNVQLLHQTHLHWPALDVDLELDGLQHPEQYTLVYRVA